MGAFSSSLLAVARRLLRKYGQNMSFSRVVEGSFTPSTGAVAAGAAPSYYAYGAPMTLGSGINIVGQRELLNTTTMQGDFLVWLEVNNSSSVPLVGDVVTLSGTAYRIISVQQYMAQGSTLIYKLIVRI